MIYRETRNFHNINKAKYSTDSKFGIPQLQPAEECVTNGWISFNELPPDKNPANKGVHFWIDDYRFDRVWSNIDRYIPKLSKYAAVVQPDFSVYTDIPAAINIYNVYRSAWIARYLQDSGINVIPNVIWSDSSSYEYCFDYLPKTGVFAISSVGTQLSRVSKVLFDKGFMAFMQRCKPSEIIFYGNVPDRVREACEIAHTRIIPVQTFTKNRLSTLKEAKNGNDTSSGDTVSSENAV